MSTKIEENNELALYGELKNSLKLEDYLRMNNKIYDSVFRRGVFMMRQGKTDVERWNGICGAHNKATEIREKQFCRYCVVVKVNTVTHILGYCPRWSTYRQDVERVFKEITEAAGGLYELLSYEEDVKRSEDKWMVMTMLGGGVFYDFEDEERLLWVSAVDNFLKLVERNIIRTERDRVAITMI